MNVHPTETKENTVFILSNVKYWYHKCDQVWQKGIYSLSTFPTLGAYNFLTE